MGTGTTEEIEEERRLLYVAMTRAKDDLHLIVPQRFYIRQQITQGDRHVYAPRTRFIPNAVTTFFESCAWPDATQVAESVHARTGESGPTVNIAEQVRTSWR